MKLHHLLRRSLAVLSLPVLLFGATTAFAAPQTITFPPIADQLSVGPGSLQLIGPGGFVFASSGLLVSFTTLTPDVCSFPNLDLITPRPPYISGLLLLKASGICTVRASQSGNAAFDAAPDVERSFMVLDGGDADSDGIPNGIEPIEGLNANLKDNDIYNSPRLFVMQQYRDFFKREGDNVEIIPWIVDIDNARETRASMLEAFITTGGFDTFAAPIARLYSGTYLRLSDYDGLAFWTEEYRSGRRSLDNISSAFSASPEFVARYGNPTNRNFVELLYANILGRASEPAGSDFWTAELDSARLSRGQILNRFTESPEYKTKRDGETFTTLMYAGMLKAAPDQSTFDATVARLNAGGTKQAEINTLLNSSNYRQRFLP